MYIKDPIKLFSKVGVLKEYNTLVSSLVKLNLSLIDLAQSVSYDKALSEDFNIDEYSEKYIYNYLEELKNAFKNNTGGELGLYDDSNIEETGCYRWTVDNFYIMVINPEITSICKNDLLDNYE